RDIRDLTHALQNCTMMNPTRLSHFHLRDGLLWYEGSCLVIPQPLRLRLLHDHHDALPAGHPGAKITYDTLARSYYWLRMTHDVKRYIDSCMECQLHKDPSHHPFGLLQPLPIPERPWASISMDFITHLP